MASFSLLIVLLKCIDFFSWPVLALCYPLYASVQAIENDDNSDTRNLISYWILLSLIYLFEYFIVNLFEWFPYWYYMKLMIVVCLVIPGFGRASHVYNQLVRPCIYMNPQVVISKFRNWKRVFVKEEDFLILAEKYMTQNGSGALEKLIASMNTEQRLDAETKMEVQTTEKNKIQQKNTAQHLDTETRKTVPTVEKNEAQQTNRVRLPLEQTDAKDLEMIEKETVPDVKPVNSVLCSLKSDENTLSNIVNAVGRAAKSIESGASHISASKSFQKEWTCAICQVTTTSEADLNSHLRGRWHKVACEALKAKNLSVAEKKKNDKSGGGESEKMIDTSNSLEQKTITCHTKTEQKNVGIVNGQKYYYRPKRTIDQENMSQKSVYHS